MGTNSWISGAAVLVLTQIGPVLTGCGGKTGDDPPSSSGGGDNVADGGSTSGGSGSGGSGGGASGGGGSGGVGTVDEYWDDSGSPGMELCLILHGGCHDGVVQAMIGWSCSPITVTCEAGCSATPMPIDTEVDGSIDYATAHALITEALCAPVPDGVAGAPGNTSSDE